MGKRLAYVKVLWWDGAGIEFKDSDSKSCCRMRLEKQKEADNRSPWS